MSDIGNAFSDSLAGLTGALSGGGAADMTGLGSGAGDISSVLSGLSNAFTPASAANANAQTVDPTGAIGASLTANPPSQGTADQQQGAVGGTQSGGSTSQGGQQQGGQGQSQSGGQGGQSQQQSGIQQLKKAIQQLLQGRTAATSYQTGAGEGAQPPAPREPVPGDDPSPKFSPLETGPLPPRDTPPAESAGLPQSPPAPGETMPAEKANVPKWFGPADTAPASVPDTAGAAAPRATQAAGPWGYEPTNFYPFRAPVGGPLLGALSQIMQSTPAETGELHYPPGAAPTDYPESTNFPTGLPPGGNAPPADPKTGLPSDPVTGKPVTPEEYRKWYNEQTKKAKKSADPALEPTKKAPPTKVPTKKPGPAAAPAPQARPPFGGGPPPGQGLGGLLQGLMSSGLPQLAMMALMGGMGGRRGRHGHWHGGRFHPNMGHFHPRFYGPRQSGGGIDPLTMMALMGGGQGGQGGQQAGQGRPAPTMQQTQNPAGPSAAPTSIPGVTGQDVDSYVRQQAQAIGVDPDVASRMVGGESSFGQNYTNPRDSNGYPSYGPFQLNMAPGAMGDQFKRDTGLDPADPATWQAQVRYALQRAKEGGWTPWTTTMNKYGYNQWSGIRRYLPPADQPAAPTQVAAYNPGA